MHCDAPIFSLYLIALLDNFNEAFCASTRSQLDFVTHGNVDLVVTRREKERQASTVSV